MQFYKNIQKTEKCYGIIFIILKKVYYKQDNFQNFCYVTLIKFKVQTV